MTREVILCVVASSSLAVAQVQLQFSSGLTTTIGVLQLPNGDRLLIGPTPAPDSIAPQAARVQISVEALGPGYFEVDPSTVGGSGRDIPQAAAVDPAGNVWIVGTTNSDDFNLVNPIVTQKVPLSKRGVRD